MTTDSEFEAKMRESVRNLIRNFDGNPELVASSVASMIHDLIPAYPIEVWLARSQTILRIAGGGTREMKEPNRERNRQLLGRIAYNAACESHSRGKGRSFEDQDESSRQMWMDAAEAVEIQILGSTMRQISALSERRDRKIKSLRAYKKMFDAITKDNKRLAAENTILRSDLAKSKEPENWIRGHTIQLGVLVSQFGNNLNRFVENLTPKDNL